MSHHSALRRLSHRTAASALSAVLVGLAFGAPASSARTVGSSATAPAPAEAGTAGLQRGLDQLVEDGAPGALLYTYDRGQVRVLHSGLANIAAGTPMRSTSRFRVGSITKSYVSTVVLKLVAHHRLHLTDPVSRYLPRLVAGDPRITIRQLLNHTSGVYEFNDDPRVLAPYLAGHLGHVWTPRQLVRIAMSHPLVAPPGTAFHYSNANYVLAGLIVRKVTGHPLRQQLRTRLFRPANLDSTTFTRSRRLPAPAVHGYFSFGGDGQLSDITSFYPYPWASGAAVGTVSDVARFYRQLLSGRLLPPRLLAAMKTAVDASAEEGPGTGYGLGLERRTTPCGKEWGHGGNFPGYVVEAYTTRTGSRQVVLMVNGQPESLPPAVGPDFDQLLNRAYCGSNTTVR
jgi:D-alanyl-D-alanine carboxypeptidase